MIRTTRSIPVVDTNDVVYYEFTGLSTDTKPVRPSIATGSLFHEVDTKKIYAYNEEGSSGEEWVEQIELG